MYTVELTAHKQEHKSLSATEKGQWSEATSKYPFDCPSLKSQQLKVQNMRRAVGDLNMLVKRTVSKIDRLSLTDEQNSEISELVQSIQCSSEGQNKLQSIYSEAEQSEEGCGAVLRALWENDASDMNQFVLDQKSNDNNYRISLRVCTCTYWCSMCTHVLFLSFSLSRSITQIHTHMYTSLVFSYTSLCQQVVSCYHTNRLVNIYLFCN